MNAAQYVAAHAAEAIVSKFTAGIQAGSKEEEQKAEVAFAADVWESAYNSMKGAWAQVIPEFANDSPVTVRIETATLLAKGVYSDDRFSDVANAGTEFMKIFRGYYDAFGKDAWAQKYPFLAAASAASAVTPSGKNVAFNP